jgi:AraC-like DNA-binding protein
MATTLHANGSTTRRRGVRNSATIPEQTAGTRLELSTDAVPAKDRFDFWRTIYCDPVGLVAEPPEDLTPFTAHISKVPVGPLFHIEWRGVTPCVVRRTRREIARCESDCLTIRREASAGVGIRYPAREFVLSAGDMLIADYDLPFENYPMDSTLEHSFWKIPKAALTPYCSPFGTSLPRRVHATDATARLLSAYLDGLEREAANMAPQTLVRVADHLCRLIGIALGAAVDERSDGVREARLAQAKQYVERHLTEPDLSPVNIASALGISRRSLHLAFELEDTTLARHILRRRLEECRSTLVTDPHRPITDIAFALGFNSLSTFYRAFQAEFDAAPGDLRAARHSAMA